MKTLNVLTAVLLIIGGLNWGLVAIAQFDLVAAVFGMTFGETNIATRIVYAVVGLSALYQAVQLPAAQRRWSSRSAAGHA